MRKVYPLPSAFPEHRVPKLGTIPLLMLGFSKKMLFLTNHQIVLVKAIGKATSTAITFERLDALWSYIDPTQELPKFPLPLVNIPSHAYIYNGEGQ